VITGQVIADEARIRLKVRGPRNREAEIDAVIDTGFTASLSLPPDLIASLALEWRSIDRGILADGSEVLFDVYEGQVLWDRQRRRILIDESDTDPLIGMALLRGYELKIQVRNEGRVSIKRLA
jgi:clan AA aspartic protease